MACDQTKLTKAITKGVGKVRRCVFLEHAHDRADWRDPTDSVRATVQ